MYPTNRFHLRSVTLILAAAGSTLPHLAAAADIEAPTVEVVGLSPIKGMEQAA